MSCSLFDLRDYFLKELSDPERKQAEGHIKGCPACREELERLRLTEAALFSLREEEIPQRIGFVSDQIFEPSPWRRAWAAFWGSAARLGFASAAMLSVALVVFALTRPPGPSVAAVGVQPVAVSSAVIQQEIQTAVQRAVTASEARQSEKFAQQVADIQNQNLKDRQQLALWADSLLDYSKRRELAVLRSSYGPPRVENGGSK